MAERVGFEPTVEFPLHTLSKRAPSTTRTSLRLESSTCERSETVYRKTLLQILRVLIPRQICTLRGRGIDCRRELCQTSQCRWIIYGDSVLKARCRSVQVAPRAAGGDSGSTGRSRGTAGTAPRGRAPGSRAQGAVPRDPLRCTPARGH